jgi:glutathione synthase
MRIGFVVNDLGTERPNYTTTHLALSALARGHETYHLDVADFSLGPDDALRAKARRPPRRGYRSTRTLLGDLQSERAVVERIPVEALDILLLRNDPADDLISRPWACMAGVNFGRLCVRRDVIVLNDPDGLAHAMNKTYLHSFPNEIRPCSIVTRDRQEIRAFVHEFPHGIVLKPVAGSGGSRVFVIEERDRRNLNQIADAVLEEGYAVAQEYLPAAESGDTRLFLMNGRLLKSKDDLVRPRLVRDGMFLVGLDIVGDKVLEVNVFSPAGLYTSGRLMGANFFPTIIDAIEHKLELKNQEPGVHANVELATL